MRIALTTVAAVAVLNLAAAGRAPAQPAAEGYHAVYAMAGYFLRAGDVCSYRAKELIETGLKFVNSDELKTIAKSFPQLTAKWMTEGAAHFNDGVMDTGVPGACAAARTEAYRARQAIGAKH